MSGLRARKVSSYYALDGLYKVMETIGSGGFSKVKLGVHVLTGEEVAIKVMDKNFLADDIPRVRLEIDAMKNLIHHNICQLYQVIETDDKFFMIMEYCTGGELFDYIVDNVRLIENEARRFFRQILSAVAYVHDQGFVHRDLKPENFLLDEKENLKLIDFGLCTQQKVESDEVDTCCGSPAYAAPELIEGKQGVGSEADVWSMGVLLYTLLCGCLPFEDDDTSFLYKKIQSGKYDVPDFLSEESASLIQKLLQLDTNHRATIEDLMEDAWVTGDSDEPVSYRSHWTRDFLDDDCVTLLSANHEKPKQEMQQLLLQWNYDYLTATYLILLSRKTKGKPLKLGNHTLESLKKSQLENLGVEVEQLDICCTKNRESLTNGCTELEAVLAVDGALPGRRPEENPRCVEVGGKSRQRTRHRSHGHFDSTRSPNVEFLGQLNGGYTKHIDSDGPTSHGLEDQFRLDLDDNGYLAAGTDAITRFQFSAGIKDSYNQDPDTSQRRNVAGRYCQKVDFNNFVENTGSPDQKGATKAQDECSWNFEGACKGARCWERKNGCTLLQSYTATGGGGGGGHHSKYFHQHLRGKARKKSVRGHHRNIRRTAPNRLASVWPLTKRNALPKHSCVKYARSLQLTARPSRVLSAAAAPATTLSKPSAPAVSAFLNSIRHSGSRNNASTKNHLTRPVSHSQSFDSQLNILSKGNPWRTPSHTDLVYRSVDAQLHRLHLNLETSHSKFQKRLDRNRLLRVLTPRQKSQQGIESQRVSDLHNTHNICVTSHVCSQTLLNHSRTA